ncbi:MAG: tyrosine-type recombinase/integrase [Flavobacteriaceae bacterium]
MDLSQLLPAFYEFLTLEKNYSDHTVKAYQRDLHSFYNYMVSSNDSNLVDVAHIDYDDCRAWVLFLLESNLSKRTVNRKVSSLSSFFKYAIQVDSCAKNPLANHRYLKIERKVSLPFSQNELAELNQLEAENNFESSRNLLMLDLLYTTGMRRAELIGLEISDVDLSQSQVRVYGKGGKYRLIPLLKGTCQKLDNYLLYRAEFENENNHLFLTSKGNKCYPNLVYRIINLYLSKVSTKLKKSPHMLRHSFATHMIDEGADLNTVKELLGHSSLAATEVYTHSSLSKLKSVYNRSHPRRQKK